MGFEAGRWRSMGLTQHIAQDTTNSVAPAAAQAEVLALGELEVFPGAGLARVAGRPLMLSVREFGVLVALLRRAGRVVSREELYGEVWGASLRADDRSVDVYVHKLRVKLDVVLPGHRLIHTHFGFGYRV
jgi:DNA-binding response OmpR family regulator